MEGRGGEIGLVEVGVTSCPPRFGPLAKIRSSSAVVPSDSVKERRERGRLEGIPSSPSLSNEMNEFGRDPDIWEGKERAESDL